MTDTAAETGWTPPYIAFKTLTTLIERMAKEEPPDQIDKSYLDNLSGGYQTQVLAALNTLELRRSDGKLGDRMKSLVSGSEQDRKEIIGAMVQQFYGPVLALGKNATQQQMIDGFTKLSPKVAGDTRRKAIAFFLAACTYAGISVSRYWKTPRVPPSSRSRGSGRADNLGDSETKTDDAPTPDPGAGHVRRLKLRSGAVVTLTLSMDPFSLSAEDRKFIFEELIDKLSAYENRHALPPGSSGEETADDVVASSWEGEDDDGEEEPF